MICRLIFANLLLDPAIRREHDGAERDEERIGRTAVVHRDVEEAGHAEGFAVGCDFFEVPAERFFAFVQTRDDLKSRSRRFVGGLAVVQRDGIERAIAEPSLVRLMEHATTFDRAELRDLVRQMFPVGGRKIVQLARGPSENLTELEDWEYAQRQRNHFRLRTPFA